MKQMFIRVEVKGKNGGRGVFTICTIKIIKVFKLKANCLHIFVKRDYLSWDSKGNEVCFN